MILIHFFIYTRHKLIIYWVHTWLRVICIKLQCDYTPLDRYSQQGHSDNYICGLKARKMLLMHTILSLSFSLYWKRKEERIASRGLTITLKLNVFLEIEIQFIWCIFDKKNRKNERKREREKCSHYLDKSEVTIPLL